MLLKTALFGLFCSPFVTAQANRIGYMPLGDSITEITCWRAELWQLLQTTGFTNTEFVGSKKGSECLSLPYDMDHEGHSGFRATDIARDNLLVGWLQQNPTDVVTMHLGTNDLGSLMSVQTIPDSFSKLVDQMRAHNPRMQIIVAQIIPIGFLEEPVKALNAAIPAWAESKSTTQSPIYVVDQHLRFLAATDTTDAVHPNALGDVKMAAKFFPALTNAIQQASSNIAKRGKVYVA